MARYSVIQTGGKQYLVRDGEEVTVQKINSEEKNPSCDVLMTFDDETGAINLGTPTLKESAHLEIVSNMKGDKVRVAKFKAKVRYRKVMGFRPQLSKVKISAKTK